MKDVDRLIRLKELIKMKGLSRSKVYKLLSEDKFPKCIRLTQRVVVWRLSEIEIWIKDRANK